MNIVGNRIKSLPEVQVDGINSSSPSHWCSHSIIESSMAT